MHPPLQEDEKTKTIFNKFLEKWNKYRNSPSHPLIWSLFYSFKCKKIYSFLKKN